MASGSLAARLSTPFLARQHTTASSPLTTVALFAQPLLLGLAGAGCIVAGAVYRARLPDVAVLACILLVAAVALLVRIFRTLKRHQTERPAFIVSPGPAATPFQYRGSGMRDILVGGGGRQQVGDAGGGSDSSARPSPSARSAVRLSPFLSASSEPFDAPPAKVAVAFPLLLLTPPACPLGPAALPQTSGGDARAEYFSRKLPKSTA